MHGNLIQYAEMYRCPWTTDKKIYLDYHDNEWGVPVFDDRTVFEFLVLESAQAGLSWLTILQKRENYRKAYDNFDPHKVKNFNRKKIEELLSDSGIVRNRRKIEASINNAGAFVNIQTEFGSFSRYIWQFVDFKPVVNSCNTVEEMPANSPLSDSISKDLKNRGFSFLGSTIMYAHLQATGIVNDHITSCFRYREIIESYQDLDFHRI